MSRQKRSVAPSHRTKLPPGVKTSWLPAGYTAESVLAGQLWKPEVGESRVMCLTGFQTKEGEIEGRKTEYLVLTAYDLTTGEEFVFVPGGLFAHLVGQDVIVTGDHVGAKYNGQKRLKTGMMANDWEIIKLKKPTP